MKHKTEELSDELLDAAVAKAMGLGRVPSAIWQPSRNWEHGGPIIERERITVGPAASKRYGWWAGQPADHREDSYGPTPLIAAMRAYVAGKVGEEVEL